MRGTGLTQNTIMNARGEIVDRSSAEGIRLKYAEQRKMGSSI